MRFDADPDMLEVGNGNLTTEEYRSHFSIWAVAKVVNRHLDVFHPKSLHWDQPIRFGSVSAGSTDNRM